MGDDDCDPLLGNDGRLKNELWKKLDRLKNEYFQNGLAFENYVK